MEMVLFFERILLLSLILECSSLHILSGKKYGEISTMKRKEIPDNCKKENFMKNYIETKTVVELETLEDLTNCSQYYPNCHYPGPISATYQEKDDGKLYIAMKFEGSSDEPNSDCWGYLVEMYEGETTTQLFVPANMKETYEADIYIRLAFEYRVVVTSLPTDKALVFTTTSPTICEFGVLDDLYLKILSKKACANANALPSYDERYQIAKTICKKYPEKRQARTKALSKKVYITNNCELKMLPSLTNESS